MGQSSVSKDKSDLSDPHHYSCLWYHPVSLVYGVHCTLYIVHCALYNVRCKLYTVNCTKYNVNFTLYSAYSTLYSLHSTLYTVHNRQCKVYTIDSVKCTVLSNAGCSSLHTICHFPEVKSSFMATTDNQPTLGSGKLYRALHWMLLLTVLHCTAIYYNELYCTKL